MAAPNRRAPSPSGIRSNCSDFSASHHHRSAKKSGPKVSGPPGSGKPRTNDKTRRGLLSSRAVPQPAIFSKFVRPVMVSSVGAFGPQTKYLAPPALRAAENHLVWILPPRRRPSSGHRPGIAGIGRLDVAMHRESPSLCPAVKSTRHDGRCSCV
jgi:hypothetical protein